jgi:hypothetical protein
MELTRKTNKFIYLSIIPLIGICLIIYMYQHISSDIILSSNAQLEIKKEALKHVEQQKAVKITQKIARGNDPKKVQSATVIMNVFPAELRAEALRVAMCESSMITHAKSTNRNGSHDWGLFQLNDGGTLQRLGGTIGLAKDAEWNAKAAYRLYQDRGWQPWVCAKKLNILKN